MFLVHCTVCLYRFREWSWAYTQNIYPDRGTESCDTDPWAFTEVGKTLRQLQTNLLTVILQCLPPPTHTHHPSSSPIDMSETSPLLRPKQKQNKKHDDREKHLDIRSTCYSVHVYRAELNSIMEDVGGFFASVLRGEGALGRSMRQ